MVKAKQADRFPQEGIFNSVLGGLGRAWKEIVLFSGRDRESNETSPETLIKQIEACLAGQGGEVSARGRAAGLARSYLAFSPEDRLVFLKILANDFSPDRARVAKAMDLLQDARTDDEVEDRQRELRNALTPARVAILRQFNTLQSGPRFLVELRRELLELKAEHPELDDLERDLKELLNTWFDVGFLSLRTINWDAPASLLEKLGHYEAVHRIRSWHDLKNRLETDRRCYAFFHPCMTDEPLIFIEVALVNGLADQIQILLDQKAQILDADDADTAIFYSISNTQQGLAGIKFGNFLIKQVVDRLRHELPNLKRFSTLSPIPGYIPWLKKSLKKDALEFKSAEIRKLKAVSGESLSSDLLLGFLANLRWSKNEELAETLRPILMRFAAIYLLKEKRPDGQRALDPVAHFHLSNGARMEQLNWMGDTSSKSLHESGGLMINYLYRLDRIDRFHEDYAASGTISASSAISALLK